MKGFSKFLSNILPSPVLCLSRTYLFKHFFMNTCQDLARILHSQFMNPLQRPNFYSVKVKAKVSVFCRYGVVLPAWFVVWRLCRTWLQHPAFHGLLSGGPSPVGSIHEKPFKGHAEGSHQWPRWPNGQNVFALLLFIFITPEETCLCPCVQENTP